MGQFVAKIDDEIVRAVDELVEAAFGDLTAIGKSRLGERVGSIAEARHQVCLELAAPADY